MATYQVLGPDLIQPVAKVSTTQVKLPTGSRVTVGGQQYATTSDLFVTTSGTGAGGLDTGTLSTSQIWYVHAVVSVGALALVASLSKTAPTGFTTFTWTGWVFFTNTSSQVATVANSPNWDWIPFSPTISASFGTTTANFFVYRRVNDALEVKGYFTTGTVTAAQATVGLGGLTTDNSGKLNGTTATVVGKYTTSSTSGTSYGAILVAGNSTTISFGIDTSTTNGLAAGNANSVVGSTLSLSFFCSVPISGWSSTGL